MTLRQDDSDAWPLRPWIMAALCAVAGLIFDQLTDFQYSTKPQALREAAATFVTIATISFVLTAELRRLTWAGAFALGWGLVIALVGWFTASYNHRPTIFEWPFLAGIFAVMIAAPLFQTVRDEGAWRFPYERLHRHAWVDGVIGGASLGFVGVAFVVAHLISALFQLIGIDVLKHLLDKSWFGWMLAGTAFGGALGLLRERDALLATLHRLVMLVFSMIAPVLAVALAIFLISFPIMGFDQPNRYETATPILLSLAAAAFVFTNAVIGDGMAERSGNRILQWSALVLVLAVLPLSLLSAYSMGQRIGQYGWTPDRMWGVVAVGVAIAYGLAGLWSVVRGRADFDDLLRPLQTKLAIGLCGLALFLALPIIDFGAISAGSQIARLEKGKVKAEEFDWTAMAFDFGEAGRRRLADIEKSGPVGQRELAKAALASENRYSVREETESVAQQARLDHYLRLLSPDIVLTDKLKAEVTGNKGCNDRPCALIRISADRLVLIYNPYDSSLQSREISLSELAKRGQEPSPAEKLVAVEEAANAKAPDLSRATIEVRKVERQQLYVNGEPVGNPIE
jgi:hypothetical protein